MNETLPTSMLAPLSDLLAAQMGLHFPANRWADLDRGMLAAAREFGFREPGACAEWLLSSPPLTRQQIETLASQLSVGETYFFREKQCFQALESEVLPELIRARAAERRLRIWSAGCATGEEPFSLAILLTRLIPGLAGWKISILGTDINPRALQWASRGCFTLWSFRDCLPGFRDSYFVKSADGLWALRPEIRKMVKFSYLNLVEDIYPSLFNDTNALDLIFCRNVLMYFALDQSKPVIERLHRCLRDDSWLVVSATEASHVLFPQFRTVNFPGAILYRKETAPPTFSFHRLTVPEAYPPPPAPPSPILALPLEEYPAWTEEPDLKLEYSEAAPVEPPEAPPDPFTDYAQGRLAEAEAGAADLHLREPGNVKAMELLARILANQGQLAQALEWCDKALAVDKLDPGIYYLRATILQEQGEVLEAARALKRALYLDHHFVLAHFALGNLHRLLGRSEEAERHFQNALRLLQDHQQEESLPESEGMTAGRLREVIEQTRVFR